MLASAVRNPRCSKKKKKKKQFNNKKRGEILNLEKLENWRWR
jgi:hypothetical protein